MILQIEDAGTQDVTLPVDWFRFVMRLKTLKKGHRYQITLDVDPTLGPSWSVVDLGKVERGNRMGAYRNGDTE